MFIGHFAAGMAGKALAPRASLGTYVAAAIFLDLLWPVFLLAGIETVRIVPGILPFSPFDFVSYPWSHSLLFAAIWSVVFGGACVADCPGFSIVPPAARLRADYPARRLRRIARSEGRTARDSEGRRRND